MPEVTLNYTAILVSAIVMMALGALWYGPLFGKQWMTLMGFNVSDPLAMKRMKEKAKPSYAISFVAALVTAYVLSHILDYAGAKTALDGAQGGLWAWLGFVATTSLGSVLWEGKLWKLYYINTAYQLASLLMIGAILAEWS